MDFVFLMRKVIKNNSDYLLDLYNMANIAGKQNISLGLIKSLGNHYFHKTY